MSKILAINAGSSSLKWQLFEMPAEKVIAKGVAERIGQELGRIKVVANGRSDERKVVIPSHQEAVKMLLTSLTENKIITGFTEIVGVGHRVVAGGEIFHRSTLIDEKVIAQIESLAEYAPLHNPAEAAGIRAFMAALPGVPEVAVFDTSFHQTLPAVNYLYSIPYEYYKKFGARKYGAHGTSYRYVSQRTADLLQRPLTDLKMIVAHLGNGTSLDAIKDGKSFNTSMGFTPLAGVTMGTRSGDIDASLVAFLEEKMDLSTEQMIHILNTKSGLLGLSGVSSDMRDLLAHEGTDPQAKVTVEIFVDRIVQYIGSYVAQLSGLDVLVFTAGIGENESLIRSRICQALGYLGVKIDEAVNKTTRGTEQIISTPNSKVKVLVVPTNEELMIARDVVEYGEITSK
ncbi:acetate/propionate family kinase [Lapidilactobacillus mulanensis]|uniref:Acetate kinase n=1 Tax=Lapidilactobacillus mulanensis TaxID=2485999 RepID=A0ABW4DIU3_9LACO|nr:acetate kinase [Lapidilactobacillus mulanensis]